MEELDWRAGRRELYPTKWITKTHRPHRMRISYSIKKEEMERLYEELNNLYYLEGIITEEEMYQKIREYNGDKNKLIEFIESIM